MGINKKVVEKFTKAYEGIPEKVSPIEFMEASPYYHQEEWREVLPMFVPGVKPGMYFISNMGRVYTKVTSPKYPNGGIMKHSINQRGYHQINLQSTDGRKIGIKIARLMLLHFHFVPGCEYLEVDHLDGNKDNNCLWNLEWVSPRINTHRAIINEQRTISCHAGYYNSGTDTFLTDVEADALYRELYKTLQNGHSIDHICKKYNVRYQYARDLIDGRVRPSIRAKYNGTVFSNVYLSEDIF